MVITWILTVIGSYILFCWTMQNSTIVVSVFNLWFLFVTSYYGIKCHFLSWHLPKILRVISILGALSAIVLKLLLNIQVPSMLLVLLAAGTLGTLLYVLRPPVEVRYIV